MHLDEVICPCGVLGLSIFDLGLSSISDMNFSRMFVILVEDGTILL